MAGYIISPRAQSDIDEIWDYTADRWGPEQAHNYVGDIRHAIEWLAGDARRGRSCDHIRPSYWQCRVGSHMVFFRVVPIGIEVVRILHQRRDFKRHLQG